ncbi:MAG: 50S ribosomal protein L11 methyltransferase [Muribaculaceae bacterium]|nr:50S ribosomal protein L11 methyltransferase [Muribaculaceae bacterium]
MNDYSAVHITVSPCTEDATDLLAALLADIDYESFVADENGLTAYVPKPLFNADSLAELLKEFPMDCKLEATVEDIEGRDWNSEWERNYFKPIVIDDRCVVHSSFHTDVPTAEYDIVIDPKMAFGTGHHATTTLILRQLLRMDLKGKSVCDMGTGTGILALLAAMRGAHPVTAIEIDSFAYTNALENLALNHCEEITLINGDANALGGVSAVEVFIANINRNVILADMHAYARALKSGGTMLLSGFYESDAKILEQSATQYGLTVSSVNIIEDGENWTCLCLKKQ